jgi:hypothetical protein
MLPIFEIRRRKWIGKRRRKGRRKGKEMRRCVHNKGKKVSPNPSNSSMTFSETWADR